MDEKPVKANDKPIKPTHKSPADYPEYVPVAKPVPATMTCSDLHLEDVHGHSCHSYGVGEGLKGWCNAGAQMVLEHEFTALMGEGGLTALDACCDCGGGYRVKKRIIKMDNPNDIVNARAACFCTRIRRQRCQIVLDRHVHPMLASRLRCCRGLLG